MRTVFLLLMTTFVVNVTGAHGQEMCSKSYVSCVDKCVVKPSASLQETCIGSCQQQNTSCNAQMYGGENLSTARTVTPEEMAKRDEEAAQAQAAEKARAEKPAKPVRQMAAPNRPADRRPR